MTALGRWITRHGVALLGYELKGWGATHLPRFMGPGTL